MRVIARKLNTWLGSGAPDEMEVVVACNGCTDDTAIIVRPRRGTVVVCNERSNELQLSLAASAQQFAYRGRTRE